MADVTREKSVTLDLLRLALCEAVVLALRKTGRTSVDDEAIAREIADVILDDHARGRSVAPQYTDLVEFNEWSRQRLGGHGGDRHAATEARIPAVEPGTRHLRVVGD